ncbi:hypothetical protein PPERSA_09678 [Pseudocohnilembus persalinus]|uniref:Condensin complex subunit 2 n=1 Tax=Pseudocohnilembus persalinus TaxID=266149 RepID=A0A0V0R705_PSEPJ|nr:hypothetical protein PPERSA_09678 [Pseudocohnilembus persalinus]|eukprot:KRX10294.1 hypothetical protein PPERSA_09678 [Pseudocohnilembus persalinus]
MILNKKNSVKHQHQSAADLETREEQDIEEEKNIEIEQNQRKNLRQKRGSAGNGNLQKFGENEENSDEDNHDYNVDDVQKNQASNHDKLSQIVHGLLLKNKINAKNAFEIPVPNVQNLTDFTNEGDFTWKVLSTTLESGAKIYGYRVEWLHSETLKILGGINRIKTDQQEEDEEEQKDPENQNKKLDLINHSQKDFQEEILNNLNNKKFRGDVTIEKRVDNLNIQKYDLEFQIDPLFQKTSAKFDGGNMSLLLNNQNISKEINIILESQNVYPIDEPKKTETIQVQPQYTQEDLSELMNWEQMFSSSLVPEVIAFQKKVESTAFTSQIRDTKKIQDQRQDYEQEMQLLADLDQIFGQFQQEQTHNQIAHDLNENYNDEDNFEIQALDPQEQQDNNIMQQQEQFQMENLDITAQKQDMLDSNNIEEENTTQFQTNTIFSENTNQFQKETTIHNNGASENGFTLSTLANKLMHISSPAKQKNNNVYLLGTEDKSLSKRQKISKIPMFFDSKNKTENMDQNKQGSIFNPRRLNYNNNSLNFQIDFTDQIKESKYDIFEKGNKQQEVDPSKSDDQNLIHLRLLPLDVHFDTVKSFGGCSLLDYKNIVQSNNSQQDQDGNYMEYEFECGGQMDNNDNNQIIDNLIQSIIVQKQDQEKQKALVPIRDIKQKIWTKISHKVPKFNESKLEEIEENKNIQKSRKQKNITFNTVLDDVGLMEDRKTQNVSIQTCFLTMLHLANEEMLQFQVHEEEDDFSIYKQSQDKINSYKNDHNEIEVE